MRRTAICLLFRVKLGKFIAVRANAFSGLIGDFNIISFEIGITRNLVYSFGDEKLQFLTFSRCENK